MTISHNGHGRSYATCDGCDANVIDLPLDIAACDRILRNFFGWTPEPGMRHSCRTCRPPPKRKRSATSYHRGMKWKQEENRT